MASTTANSDYDLTGYLPLNIPKLTSTRTLGQAIASKAAAIYAFYRDNATKQGPPPRTVRCEECRRRKIKCEHNTPPVIGTLVETKAAAKVAFQFFIDQCAEDVLDIAGRAREFLHQKRSSLDDEEEEQEVKETPLLVEMIMGIVGVVHAYQTNLCHAPTQIPELLVRYNSLPKGTERVMTAPVEYAEEVSEWVWVFEELIAKLEGEGPDGSEGDEVDEGQMAVE